MARDNATAGERLDQLLSEGRISEVEYERLRHAPDGHAASAGNAPWDAADRRPLFTPPWFFAPLLVLFWGGLLATLCGAVPEMAAIYEELDAELPVVTQLAIDASFLTMNYFVYSVPTQVLLLVFVALAYGVIPNRTVRVLYALFVLFSLAGLMATILLCSWLPLAQLAELPPV